jgi:2-aminoethylphosphonate-pyruvate transaminase
MRELGFQTFLPAALQAPIIVTFHAPADPNYDFKVFYSRVRERGFILYPGKLTAVETFRVGCIGAIGADTMKQAVAAIADTLGDMQVRHIAPALAALSSHCHVGAA